MFGLYSLSDADYSDVVERQMAKEYGVRLTEIRSLKVSNRFSETCIVDAILVRAFVYHYQIICLMSSTWRTSLLIK